MDILTTEHPLWHEFLERLSGPEGCDFKRDDNSQWVWDCNGLKDRFFARSILKTMPVDVDGTLNWLEQQGAECDCMILFSYDFKLRSNHVE